MRPYLAPPPVVPLQRGSPPSFSVVIACYQAAAVVGDAVRSALEQTYAPLEVIVSDDGSTDDPEAALAPYADRLVLLRGENRGPAAARNAAFRAARGDYVAILDADDVFLAERLEAIADLLAERPDLDVVTTDAIMELGGRPVRNLYNERWTFEVHDQRGVILERNFVFGLAVVRRSTLESAGGMDETAPIGWGVEDWDLWLRLIHAGSVVGLVDDPLARNRLGAASLSTDRRGRLEGAIAVLEKALANLDLRPGERDAAESTLARLRLERAFRAAREAVAAGRDVRSRAKAVVLSPPRDRRTLMPRTRLRAAGWALAPGLARSRLRAAAEAGWEGAGGLRHRREPRPISVVYYTDAQELGGAELSLANLLAVLSDRVSATVVGTDRRVVDRLAATRPGTGTIVVPRIESLFDVRSIHAHGAAFRRLRPDIVQVTLNNPWACTWAQLVAATIPGVRVIAVEQLPRRSDHRWDPLLKRLVERGVSAHVVVGSRSADELARLTGLRRDSLRTIYNGIADLDLEPVPRETDGFVVGSLGRLHAQKGYDVLVRALARLDGVTAVLVGEGEQRQELVDLAAELGVADRLVVQGWADDARRHLTGFDAFVLPSRFEAFPLSIVEAMLAGLPVVAGDVGSVAEAVVDGSTGVLVPPDDVEALAAAIERLRMDTGLRRELGARGRRRALDLFTAGAMASRFEALYDEVLR